MCIYIYIYMCTYTYMYMYVYVYIHISLSIYIYIYIYVYICCILLLYDMIWYDVIWYGILLRGAGIVLRPRDCWRPPSGGFGPLPSALCPGPLPASLGVSCYYYCYNHHHFCITIIAIISLLIICLTPSGVRLPGLNLASLCSNGCWDHACECRGNRAPGTANLTFGSIKSQVAVRALCCKAESRQKAASELKGTCRHANSPVFKVASESKWRGRQLAISLWESHSHWPIYSLSQPLRHDVQRQSDPAEWAYDQVSLLPRYLSDPSARPQGVASVVPCTVRHARSLHPPRHVQLYYYYYYYL